jgi:aspartate-semialdehyde dehydrogenase
MIVPLVNASHLDMIEQQLQSSAKRRGFIVTNCNCSTAGLVVPLKALDDAFGVEKVFVVTMQAISGAGYPGNNLSPPILFSRLYLQAAGVASLDIIDNVVPYISGEEEKMEIEPLKILGRITTDKTTKQKAFKYADIQISAQCNRVHVLDGHTESVSVKLKTKPSVDQVKKVLQEYTSEAQHLKLPSAPQKSIVVMQQQDRPQPRLDRQLGNGYSVSVGRVRECPLLDIKFTVLSHNTVLGAAGGAILAAELCKAKNYL